MKPNATNSPGRRGDSAEDPTRGPETIARRTWFRRGRSGPDSIAEARSFRRGGRGDACIGVDGGFPPGVTMRAFARQRTQRVPRKPVWLPRDDRMPAHPYRAPYVVPARMQRGELDRTGAEQPKGSATGFGKRRSNPGTGRRGVESALANKRRVHRSRVCQQIRGMRQPHGGPMNPGLRSMRRSITDAARHDRFGASRGSTWVTANL